MNMVSERAYLLVQAVTVVTFLVSSYFVGLKYPGTMVSKTELFDEVSWSGY